MLESIKNIKRTHVYIGLLSCLLIIISWKTISTYLHLSFSINHLWLLLLPFIVYVKKQGAFSVRYGILALIFLIAHYFVPTPFFVFLSLCFSILFLIESKLGKLNILTPVMIILITPLTKFFFDVFGFPIRLKLTEIASILINKIGYASTLAGNRIIIDGQVFSVDQECMGLKMVITSLLISLMLIALLEKKRKRELHILISFSILGFTAMLIVVSNLFRIISLILFKSMPNTLSHELIGVFCLLFFTVLPSFIIIHFLVSKYAKPYTWQPKKINPQIKNGITFLLPALLFVTVISTKEYQDIPIDPLANEMELQGFDKEVLANNIIKFSTEESLIYVKPCKSPFRGNHNPYLCWRGSGYEIKNPEEITINGHILYTAQLVSDKETLQTAWYYDNGTHQTINQMEWRWNMLKGEDSYRLINVTASDYTSLLNQLELVLEMGLIHPIN